MYIDLKRIEFVITNACSSNCKHCSAGEHIPNGGGVDSDTAVVAIKRLAERFKIESVMTFGGEPLLYAETVCKIHVAARDCGIPKRQIITNGYFSRDEQKIDKVAEGLCTAGVNDVLLSVDVFHQEYMPLEPVMQFADALIKHGVPALRVQPAWLVNEMLISRINNEIVAAIVFNENQEKEYLDGHWNNNGSKTAVIHRLCVKPQFQGYGMATKLMKYVESNLKNNSYNDIRLDAFSKNPYAVNLYKKIGYKEVGETYFRKGRFLLFEKVLQM